MSGPAGAQPPSRPANIRRELAGVALLAFIILTGAIVLARNPLGNEPTPTPSPTVTASPTMAAQAYPARSVAAAATVAPVPRLLLGRAVSLTDGAAPPR